MFHVALIRLPVTDISSATRFYSALLEQEPDVEAPEFGWAHYEAAALTLALYVPGQGGGDRPPGGSADFHLAHADLEGLLARIAPHAADAAIHDNADGSRSLELSDPDGNALKIMGPSKSA
jgi:Predicted ring-cleavage extradiol dioxygenase